MPDVAIVDVRMPPTHTDEGLRAAAEIRERFPAPACSCSPSTSRRATRSSCSPTAPRASATCSRTASPTSTRFVGRRAPRGEGGSALDPEVVARCSAAAPRGSARRAHPREREVLGLMAEGRSNGGDRRALVVTERAVEKHVTQHLLQARPPAAEDHRRVLAVLTNLAHPLVRP